MSSFPPPLATTAAAGRLAGRCVVVTGAAAGIGLTLAQAAVAEGAHVIVADANEATARDAAASLGDQATFAWCDVRSEPQVEAVVELAERRFGGVDVLVNNAGRHLGEFNVPCTQISVARWTELFEVNLTAPLTCVRACAASMRSRGGGSVINISSASAHQPTRAYGVSKFALLGLTVALADELGADGTRVNAIAPGLVDTPAATAQWPPERAATIIARQALRRPGLVQDLVPAFLFLASDDSAFVTGQTIWVDGGMTRHV